MPPSPVRACLVDVVSIVVEKCMGREPLFVTSGAPGDGKTRFVWNLAQRGIPATGEQDLELEAALESPKLTQEFVQLIRNAVGITAMFSFLSQVVPGEDPSDMLGTRMLYSHFKREGEYGDFLASVMRSFGRGVYSTEALSIIRAGIDRQFSGQNRAIILVLDDLSMSGLDTYLLGEISTFMELPDVQRLFFPILTHVSPERVDKLESDAVRRNLPLIMAKPLDHEAVDRLAASLKHCKVLEWPSFRSVLRECGGVPRCLEFVCRAAESADVECFKDRSSLILHLRNIQGYFVNFVSGRWKESAERAVFFAFSGWIVYELKRDSELRRQCEDLFTKGFLHLSRDAYFKYGIPPMFCFLWRELENENDLLAAIIEFLELDEIDRVSGSEVTRVELQVGALFRILSAADDRLRRREESCIRELGCVPKHRCVLGMIDRPVFRSVFDMSPERVTVQASLPFNRVLLPNKYLLGNHRFEYGENLALLGCGRYMPKLLDHEGLMSCSSTDARAGASVRSFSPQSCAMCRKRKMEPLPTLWRIRW